MEGIRRSIAGRVRIIVTLYLSLCRAGPARDPEVICRVGNMWFNPKMPGQPPSRPARVPAANATVRLVKPGRASPGMASLSSY